MIKMPIPYPASGAQMDADDVATLSSTLLEIADGKRSFFPYPEQEDFCEHLRRITGGRHIVPLSSCAAALDCALVMLNIGPGDEVITTPLTFVATASSVALTGARVVFADIDPVTLNLDPASVRERITARTRAIIPVHFAGLPNDVHAYEDITRSTGIPVIYDAAHALGASKDGQPIGQFGAISCFSFQFNKHVTCLGEGGALVCDSPDMARAVAQYKSFGFSYPASHTFDGGVVQRLGTNLQMTKLQLLAGTLQLKKFAGRQAVRKAIFMHMRKALEDIDEIELPDLDTEEHACLLFVIRTRANGSREDSRPLRESLQSDFGIETRVHYKPMWEWPVFEHMGYSGQGCPQATQVIKGLISLPVSIGTTPAQCDYIAQAIRKCLTRH